MAREHGWVLILLQLIGKGYCEKFGYTHDAFKEEGTPIARWTTSQIDNGTPKSTLH